MKRLIVSLALVLSACAPLRPPVVPQPQPDTPLFNYSVVAMRPSGAPLATATARIIDGPHVGRTVTANQDGFLDFGPLAQADFNVCVEAPGYDGHCFGVHLFSEPPTSPRITLAELRRPGRTGVVRVENRAFADDGGPWNPLGASLFWALWGEKHDPERLDRNLAHLAEHGVDYVRILGMVGAPSWEDRTINPKAPDYWDVAGKFFDRLERHGLRAQVTVFADAQVMMPDREDRRSFAVQWAQFVNSRLSRVFALEVVNEGWQNGFDDVAHLREIGRLLGSLTEAPIALTAAPHDPPSSWCDIYADAGADFTTLHYDRDLTRDGPWRTVRQTWGYVGEYDGSAWDTSVTPWQCGGRMPRAAVSNEPIGPQSSVAEDADPTRLAMSYATTFVAGNAAYVYHAGAGIRGGGAADAARGRLANLYDYDPAILDALAAVRKLLPDGVANWQRHNAQWASMPFAGLANPEVPSLGAVDRDDIHRAYAATNGGRFVLVLLEIKRGFRVTAKSAMQFSAYDPRDGSVVQALDLPVGGAWDVPAMVPGLLVIGEFR